MSNMTIPGGAYKLPDGTWIDGNGKRIKSPANEAELYEPREVISLPTVLPRPVDALPVGEGSVTTSGEEFEKPEVEIDEETDKQTTRRVTKSKKGS